MRSSSPRVHASGRKAKLKSTSIGRLYWLIMMLPGLMSRWITPREWA